jgi:hypothetical protein
MDWGPIIAGILVAILLLLTVPIYIDESIQKLQQQPKLFREIIQIESDNGTEIIEDQTEKSDVWKTEPTVKPVVMEIRQPKESQLIRNLIRRSEPQPNSHPDPRFAAPEIPLICTLNKQKPNFVRQETRAIGCCPENDEDGIPYGPGRACCCGKVYSDDGSKFCCENSCLVMSVSEQNLALCSDEFKNSGNSGNSGKGFGRLGDEEDDYDEFTSTTTSTTSTTTTTSTT